MDNKLPNTTGPIVASGNNAGNNPGNNIANSTANHSDSLARGTEQFAEDLKHKWQDIEHAVSVKGKEMRTLSRDYINHAPFKSVLAASAAGLVLGYLISKFRN